MKNTYISGFKRLFSKLCHDDIFASSAQLSYYLILSFFPFLIFVISSIGYLNLDSSEIIYGLKLIFPETVHNLVISTINQIVNVRNNELFWLSLVGALVSASTGFRGTIKAINKSYGVRENRFFPLVWLISIISTVALAAAIIFTLILLIFGKSIGNFIYINLGLSDIFLEYWNKLRLFVPIISIIFSIACIYKFAPAYRPRWKQVYIGAVVSTIGWLIISFIFSKIITIQNSFSMLYGSLSSIFALIVWLYLTSFIFILGMEVNSAFVMKRNCSSITIKNS